MEQYKSEGVIDSVAVRPVTISAETKQIQSVESLVKQLQENVSSQQQEIMHLHREIGRLKNYIDDIASILRQRG
jgi:peptidoglycan hydrolase CwlO-like protein